MASFDSIAELPLGLAGAELCGFLHYDAEFLGWN
jgi:hypothetical protein